MITRHRKGAPLIVKNAAGNVERGTQKRTKKDENLNEAGDRAREERDFSSDEKGGKFDLQKTLHVLDRALIFC